MSYKENKKILIVEQSSIFANSVIYEETTNKLNIPLNRYEKEENTFPAKHVMPCSYETSYKPALAKSICLQLQPDYNANKKAYYYVKATQNEK